MYSPFSKHAEWTKLINLDLFQTSWTSLNNCSRQMLSQTRWKWHMAKQRLTRPYPAPCSVVSDSDCPLRHSPVAAWYSGHHLLPSMPRQCGHFCWQRLLNHCRNLDYHSWSRRHGKHVADRCPQSVCCLAADRQRHSGKSKQCKQKYSRLYILGGPQKLSRLLG